MDKDFALTAALGAIELHLLHHEPRCVYLDSVLPAIREALAQQERPQNCGSGFCSCIECVMKPEQEPVAWIFQHDETGHTMCVDERQIKWGFEKANSRWKKISPLYATPPKREWVGLTDEELLQLSNKWRIIYGGHVDDFAKEIETKLKEKNT